MQFMGNRVVKIQEQQYIQWRHIGTVENQTDLGSSGSDIDNFPVLWWQGPDWLSELEKWPADILTRSTKESEEVKIVRELLAVAVENKQDPFGELHVLRLGAWIVRFLQNSRVNQYH